MMATQKATLTKSSISTNLTQMLESSRPVQALGFSQLHLTNLTEKLEHAFVGYCSLTNAPCLLEKK